MIIEHAINGSKDTSIHDFKVSVSGMNLTLSNGSYFRGGKELFTDNVNTVVTIPTSTDLTYYEVWITENGLSILTRKETDDFPYNLLTNQIDRLCWLTIPANCTDLNSAEIHVIKVVE
jgi:hypothetical protein